MKKEKTQPLSSKLEWLCFSFFAVLKAYAYMLSWKVLEITSACCSGVSFTKFTA